MSGVLETIGLITQSISDMIKPALQGMGKFAETMSRYFETYQKLDFSGYNKIFENLSTLLTLPDNPGSEEETMEGTDEIQNSQDVH